MADLVYDKTGRLLFTKGMKKEYTLLVPQMLPDHFAMIVEIIRTYGYKVDMLENTRLAASRSPQRVVNSVAGPSP